MKYIFYRAIILYLTLFATTIIFAQPHKISIYANSKKLLDNQIIYLTGNTDNLGNWNEMLPMKKESEYQWSFETTAEQGDTLEFKFTRGSWMTEAVDSTALEYPNFVHVVTEDTTLVYTIPGWRDIDQQKIILSKERLSNKAGAIDLLEGWRYKTGDDSVWADPNFNDSNWKIINPLLNKEDFEKLEWTGNIWFRNHIVVDTSLWDQPFDLSFFVPEPLKSSWMES